MDQRKSDIRRKLLEANRQMGRATVDELCLEPGLQLLQPSREEIVAAIRDLLAYGYISYPIPGDYSYSEPTAEGVRQINRDGKLDPAIWGRHA